MCISLYKNGDFLNGKYFLLKAMIVYALGMDGTDQVKEGSSFFPTALAYHSYMFSVRRILGKTFTNYSSGFVTFNLRCQVFRISRIQNV